MLKVKPVLELNRRKAANPTYKDIFCAGKRCGQPDYLRGFAGMKFKRKAKKGKTPPCQGLVVQYKSSLYCCYCKCM